VSKKAQREKMPRVRVCSKAVRIVAVLLPREESTAEKEVRIFYFLLTSRYAIASIWCARQPKTYEAAGARRRRPLPLVHIERLHDPPVYSFIHLRTGFRLLPLPEPQGTENRVFRRTFQPSQAVFCMPSHTVSTPACCAGHVVE